MERCLPEESEYYDACFGGALLGKWFNKDTLTRLEVHLEKIVRWNTSISTVELSFLFSSPGGKDVGIWMNECFFYCFPLILPKNNDFIKQIFQRKTTSNGKSLVNNSQCDRFPI